MKKLIWLLMFVLTIFVVTATNENTFTKDETVNITFPCYDEDAYCSINTSCYITINYPNGTNMINNQTMGRDNALYSYSPSDSSKIGTYSVYAYCTDGAELIDVNFTYDITYAGWDEVSTMTIIIAAGIMAGLLIILAIIIKEKEMIVFKWAFALMALLLVLIVIPSALISKIITFNLFRWGLIFTTIIYVGIFCLLIWVGFKKIHDWVTGKGNKNG